MNDFTIDKSKTHKDRINAYTFENNIGQIARSEPLEKGIDFYEMSISPTPELMKIVAEREQRNDEFEI